jgi:hypothetical protein
MRRRRRRTTLSVIPDLKSERTLMSRKLTFAGVALALAVAVAGIAAAEAPAQAATPIDPASTQQFTVACSTGRHALITLPVRGSFVPGSVVGTDSTLVPYRFDYRWTDGNGDVLLRSQAEATTGPVPRDAIVCGLAPIAYPDGTFLTLTVTAVVR